MSLVRNIVLVVAFAAVSVLSVSAEEAQPQTVTKTPPVLKNQTLCPVMGGKIDSTVFTDIQGQRVYHCCPMCSAKLKADPDKYFKEAAAQGILFENIQTTCPVSGEELKDKSVHIDFEGRRVAFCCEKCIGDFNKDPQKYLKKLDEKAAPEKTEPKMDHSGMNN